MTEAKERARENEETAPCLGKPSGHDVSRAADGLAWVSDELGDMGTDVLSIWDAVADGGTVTLRCRECDALLSVSLKVEVKG